MSNPSSKKVAKKPKLVRDSFTIPKNEFAAIDELKTRAMAMGTAVKKSELLRAGLKALLALSDSGFKSVLASVPTLKTGRPHAATTTPVKSKPVSSAKPRASTTTKPSAKPAAKVVKTATTARKRAPAAKKPAAAPSAPAKKAVARKRPAPRTTTTSPAAKA
ncbi:hypothetical protein [Hydrogenophaga sp.]|uniref:hypothetical protein n=1 Tax=Hydrogenophaga sp. TaxID=1904254 RepID=UPI003568F93E